MEFDELLPIRNNLYLGAYNNVISTLETLSPSYDPQINLNRRIIQLRAYLSKKDFNSSSSADASSPIIQVLNILTKYLSGKGAKAEHVDAVKLLMNKMNMNDFDDEVLHVLIASLFYYEGLYVDALRLLALKPKGIECSSLNVQIFLEINRPDLAKKEIEKIKTWADDATLAQFTEAWVDAFTGGPDKYQNAFYIFEELCTSKVSTSKLLCGQAICRMQMGRFEDAESILLESLNKSESDSSPNDDCVLINLISCALNLGKSADKYIGKLKELYPQHGYLKELTLKESLFDRCAARYTV